jgi:hypothetical protein
MSEHELFLFFQNLTDLQKTNHPTRCLQILKSIKIKQDQSLRKKRNRLITQRVNKLKKLIE